MNNLIFQDEQFEAYINNLSLYLSTNIQKTISEAHRVLLPGGVAAFCTWGKKSESYFNCFLSDELEKFGIREKLRTDYYQRLDDTEIRKIFEKCGFRNIKIEYTNILFDVYSITDFMEKYHNSFINEVLKVEKNDKKVKEYLEYIKEEAEKNIIIKDNLPILNCQIIIAFKQ